MQQLELESGAMTVYWTVTYDSGGGILEEHRLREKDMSPAEALEEVLHALGKLGYTIMQRHTFSVLLSKPVSGDGKSLFTITVAGFPAQIAIILTDEDFKKFVLRAP